jgi:hypothetical protein
VFVAAFVALCARQGEVAPLWLQASRTKQVAGPFEVERHRQGGGEA